MWAIEQAAASKYIDHTKVSLDGDRPPELCADDASNEDVVRYHLAQHPHDWVVLLQPTSPLRTIEDIDACIERAQLGAGCISVNEIGDTNGAVYVATANWIREHDFSHRGLMKYRMPDERSLDIDYEDQFE
jgi:CMP-N-acetylneuraminic acid synthetase